MSDQDSASALIDGVNVRMYFEPQVQRMLKTARIAERQRIREAVEEACWQRRVVPQWLMNILKGNADD